MTLKLVIGNKNYSSWSMRPWVALKGCGIVFEEVFVPHEHVFMDGEWAYASSLVERFTTYHRSSYVCKTGLGDVLIGAAASAAEHNGVESASHIKDKLVEMTHLNETIYSSCMAGAHQAKPAASGVKSHVSVGLRQARVRS